MFILLMFHAIHWSQESFVCCTCFNFVPVCGPGTGMDSSGSEEFRIFSLLVHFGFWVLFSP